MATSSDKEALKQIFKEAFSESLQENRDVFRELFAEALGDMGLSNAIEEGLESETVSREEVFAILERQKVRSKISAYAKAVAGSVDDLDEDLERAALESWSDLP